MDFPFPTSERLSKYRKKFFTPDGKNCEISIDCGRALADDDLVAKLKKFGIEMSRDLFLQLVKRFLSVEELFYWYYDQSQIRKKLKRKVNEEWLWVCLVVLWERWAADKPSFDLIDELMQKGYLELNKGNLDVACDLWIQALDCILIIMEDWDMNIIEDLDNHFKGSETFSDWLKYVETATDGIEIKSLFQLKTRIEISRAYLKNLLDNELSLLFFDKP